MFKFQFQHRPKRKTSPARRGKSLKIEVNSNFFLKI